MSNGKFVCEFCKNEYKTVVSLRNHQSKATFCKNIRGEPVLSSEKKEYKKEDKKVDNNLVKELQKKIEEQSILIKKLEDELKQYKTVDNSDNFGKTLIKKLENNLNRGDLVEYLIKSNQLLSEKTNVLSSNKNSNKSLIKKCVDWFKLDIGVIGEKDLKIFFTIWTDLINEMYNLDVINDEQYDENIGLIDSLNVN
jgi:hypothetical protein